MSPHAFSQFSLEGKLALVTGASRGIGEAIALTFARSGADVATVSRTENVGLTDSIRAMGRKCAHIAADLADREQVADIVPAVVQALGHPDILVNNAGALRRSRGAINFSQEDWDWSLQLDLTTPYMLTMACARYWIDAGKPGKVINILSVMALSGGMDTIGYTAAKHGLAGLTKTLANDWAKLGINVNGIAPGYIRTDMTAGLHSREENARKFLSRVPSGTFGEPEDVANCVLFLASPAARWVHGSIYLVDGGHESW